jgi:recombination protein RecR
MYEGTLQQLIDELGRLPGVGPKSAQRIAFYLIEAESDVALRLAEVLQEVKEKVRFCETCGNVSESEKCFICSDQKRDQGLVCVPKTLQPSSALGSFVVCITCWAEQSRQLQVLDQTS